MKILALAIVHKNWVPSLPRIQKGCDWNSGLLNCTVFITTRAEYVFITIFKLWNSFITVFITTPNESFIFNKWAATYDFFYDMTNNLLRKREEWFHLDETMYTLFKKMKLYKTSIVVNKVHYIP
jgi:hypothetical protein